jgi:hypothetical protein
MPADGRAGVQGLMKVYTNQAYVLESSLAGVENTDKEQAPGVEIAESFILCSRQAYKKHIKA